MAASNDSLKHHSGLAVGASALPWLQSQNPQPYQQALWLPVGRRSAGHNPIRWLTWAGIIAQEAIQSEVVPANPAAIESVAQAILEPNAITATKENNTRPDVVVNSDGDVTGAIAEIVGQIEQRLDEAPSSEPMCSSDPDPEPQPQSPSQTTTRGVTRSWSWSSIKSSVRPVKEKWESYGPAVHASLAVLDLFILSWQLHSMRSQNPNVQVVLASPNGYNNTVMTMKDDKELSAELQDLTSQALEQKKWDQMHGYVQTCLEYLVSHQFDCL